MQTYLELLGKDLELLKVLKISSIDGLLTIDEKSVPKSFYIKFGKSWCADFKTVHEKEPQIIQNYPEIFVDQPEDDAVIIYSAQDEKLSIILHKLVGNSSRNMIFIVAANACLNVVCDSTQLSQTAMMLMHIEQHAQMQLLLEDSDTQKVFCGVIAAHLYAHATLEVNQYQAFGKQLYYFDYYLKAPYASIKHQSFGAITDTMYQAISTRQFHQAEHTKSTVSIKTLLDGSARSFYRGTIAINTDGAGSIAQQQHRGLLVNQNAYTCGIPSLEVEMNDVQCTHGTAASSLDEQLLWYLQSRGLSYIQARQFLIRSFLTQSNVSSVQLESIISLAQQRIEYDENER